jgi:holin-like protein
MELLNRNQAIWLARGVALGIFLRRLLRALRRVTGQLRYTSPRRQRVAQEAATPIAVFDQIRQHSARRPAVIGSLTTILALTVAGDVIVGALDAPIPGAAIGMLLLSIAFASRGGVDAASAKLFDAASPHFTLFFVPAAVGIAASGELLAQAWLYIAVAIVLSTAATIALTGLLTQYLLCTVGRTQAA